MPKVGLQEPFNFDDADVILRARGVDFRVHKLVLTHASTVFKDMFSLPRNRSASQENIPVIEVTEDPQTIHDVLSLIYPNSHNIDLDNFSTLQRVSLASRKYSVDNARLLIQRVLQLKAAENPVRVFALACNAEEPNVARNAARHSLRQDYRTISTLVFPELKRLSANTMCKLFVYHTKCGEVASKAVYRYLGQCPISSHTHPSAGDVSGKHIDLQKWWKDHVTRTGEDTKCRPLQGPTNVSLIQEVCNLQYSCTACASAATKLLQLSQQLENEIQVAIENVRVIIISI